MNLIEKNNNLLLYENVLSKEQNAELYAHAINKFGKYVKTNAKVNDPIYPNWRKSRVIYHWDFEQFYLIMQDIVIGKLNEVREVLLIDFFEVDKTEIQLTVHNNGDYYKCHTDNSSQPTSSRVITFVYYFHLLPKAFSGGELVIYPSEMNPINVSPINNTIVFFHSSLKHEVKPVITPSLLFEEGRFTLNGWIRKKDVQIILNR